MLLNILCLLRNRMFGKQENLDTGGIFGGCICLFYWLSVLN